MTEEVVRTKYDKSLISYWKQINHALEKLMQMRPSKQKKLFEEWLKRDTWLIYDEAMPLINAEKPEEETMFGGRDQELWALVNSCAGFSLTLTNIEQKPKLWRVTPFEWIRWLKEKNISINHLLESKVYPKDNVLPTHKTAHANNSRELKKAHRHKTLKEFCEVTAEIARKKNIEWDNKEIPVTKSEFLEIFYEKNTLIERITLSTFDNDISDIGIKFKRGTKNNKNNRLKSIYSMN